MLGVSYDSAISVSYDLDNFSTRSIAIQKPKMFKAPVGFKLRSREGTVKDVVRDLYSDLSANQFEAVPYARLSKDDELIGVYGYYQAHYISHLGFMAKTPATENNQFH